MSAAPHSPAGQLQNSPLTAHSSPMNPPQVAVHSPLVATVAPAAAASHEFP